MDKWSDSFNTRNPLISKVLNAILMGSVHVWHLQENLHATRNDPTIVLAGGVEESHF